MLITHHGHSSLSVELLGAKVLFDPGKWSSGFENVNDLDALLITHQHPDHLDKENVAKIVAANPQAKLITDAQSAQILGDQWCVAKPGETIAINDQLSAYIRGGKHEVIYPEFPNVDNIVFQLGTDTDPAQFVHPGDLLYVPEEPVGVLAFPAAAPWMKLEEGINYLRKASPRIAIPIHLNFVIPDARENIFVSSYQKTKPQGTQIIALSEGQSVLLNAVAV